MLLFFALLAWRPQVANAIEPTALELLRHLSLLFVPAAVGVMVSATELRGNTLAVIVTVAVSTALAIAMTAVVTLALLRMQTVNAIDAGDEPRPPIRRSARSGSISPPRSHDPLFSDSNVVASLFSSNTAKADWAGSPGVQRNSNPVISTQMMNEVTRVMRRKLDLPWDEINALMDDVAEFCEIDSLTLETREEARRFAEHGLRFYDSCILAFALLQDCEVLYGEDMQYGQVVFDRLTVINSFQVSQLIIDKFSSLASLRNPPALYVQRSCLACMKFDINLFRIGARTDALVRSKRSEAASRGFGVPSSEKRRVGDRFRRLNERGGSCTAGLRRSDVGLFNITARVYLSIAGFLER